MSKCTIFVGPFIHSIYEDQITCVENGVIAVSDGKIVAVGDDGNVDYIRSTLPNIAEIVTLKNGEFLCPGFIDLHIHASQYPNAGLGYDSELIHWLTKYTYPLEQKYNDDIFARKVYRAVVNRTLSCGTTTAVYFGTIHLKSNMVLAEELVEAGQRAFVGKVNMNVRSPPGYLETTESSISDTEKFIFHVKNLKCPLIQPIITPRFALTCDLTLMERLAELAKKYDLYIQSHVSENKDEVKCMNELYPEFENYTDIYDKAGLLTDKTVLAHGVYLTPSEIKVLSKRRAAIAHCPVSNTSLKSGLCDIKLLIREGVLVGLGTDVSGGYSPSILNTIRAAIDMSIHVSFSQKDCYSPLTFHEAFYLATLGGAKALKLENSIGNFTVGKDFDALRINLYSQDSQIDCFEDLSLIEKVQKFLYLGDDRNIRQVYVNGKLVKNKKNIIN